jgi:hypothetical protein
MTWIKLNDSIMDNPKMIGLSEGAIVLYITGLCYASKHLTDGQLNEQFCKKTGRKSTIKELNVAGLWVKNSEEIGGFLIHDYLKHQASKEDIERKTDQNNARQTRYKEKNNALPNALVTRPDTDTDTDTDTDKSKDKKISLEFEDFWNIYPRKVSKANSLKAFLKARKKTSLAEIVLGVQQLTNDPRFDLEFCPHASTWLNGKRWADEVIPMTIPQIAQTPIPRRFTDEDRPVMNARTSEEFEAVKTALRASRDYALN